MKFSFLILILYIPVANAYLDPGTGSMLLSVFIGLMSSAYFAIRKFPELLRRAVFRSTNRTDLLKKNNIVIYSESKSYWSTFKPLLDEFAKRNTDILYLTSANNDPAFSQDYPDNIKIKYIGTGNKAYTALNFLEAKVFVLTTPGIDVLQIKRSKGVNKYVHVIHSVTDIHFYKYFAFDYYDEVIVNGEYQKKNIEHLENVRNTTKKRIPVLGILYFDVLMNRINSELLDCISPNYNTVLLAPTWGKNGMLSRFGSKIPVLLANAGFNVIFRPHPQSYISEKELIESLKVELKKYPNVEWDYEPDGFVSMKKAALLVSDLSGIVFDFAFCFLRPVVTIGFEINPNGFEAFDLDSELWDLTYSDDFGKRLDIDEINSLPDIAKKLIADRTLGDRIKQIRTESVANFGNCASIVADEIIKQTELNNKKI